MAAREIPIVGYESKLLSRVEELTTKGIKKFVADYQSTLKRSA